MIETNRLKIRNFKETDIDDYFEFVSQKDVLSRVGVAPYEKKEQALERLIYESKKTFRYAIILKKSGKLIGNISLNEPKVDRYKGIEIDQNTMELGYLLSHDYWGQGIIPEAAKAVLNYAFEKLGVTKIVCGANSSNKQSLRVQEKLGFKFDSIIKNFETWVDGTVTDYIRTILTKEEWKKISNKN